MIERHFIEVFGTTYMVEIETLEKVENKVEGDVVAVVYEN